MISNELARLVGWEPSEATGFILTGQAPSLYWITAQVERHVPMALTRVTLSVDPHAAPAALAEAFRQIQQNYQAAYEKREGQQRTRSFSEKRFALAAFSLTRPAAESVSSRLNAWNREAEQYLREHHLDDLDALLERWQYRSDQSGRSRFTRDYAAAARTLGDTHVARRALPRRPGRDGGFDLPEGCSLVRLAHVGQRYLPGYGITLDPGDLWYLPSDEAPNRLDFQLVPPNEIDQLPRTPSGQFFIKGSQPVSTTDAE